jgi:hypothetical protein
VVQVRKPQDFKNLVQATLILGQPRGDPQGGIDQDILAEQWFKCGHAIPFP